MALKRIILRDFAIVSEIELELDNGFTVFTGETGAGKSILIEALQLVTGAKADVNVIREGCARTEVGAEFDAVAGLADWLQAAGFDSASTLLLRRTVDPQGRSRAWINGSAATATQLREIGEQLLDIHGQQAWQSLTHPHKVRDLLDAYARINGVELATRWQRWRRSQDDLARAQTDQVTAHARRDNLLWQIGELEKLSPQPQEWERLGAEHDRLANAQGLLLASQGALIHLDDDDNGALTALHRATQLLQQQEHVEPCFRPLVAVLTSSLAQVQDTVHSLRSYRRDAELDPQRLAEIDERMALWLSLARRHKVDAADLPARLEQWREELLSLEASTNLAALQEAQDAAAQDYTQEAGRIAQARAAAAPALAQAVTQAMQGLGMSGGTFEVQLQTLPQPSSHGLEEVVFLVAAHPGSSARPVNKVASGGELSRIALAIAVTTSELGSAQTLIFDEVDAGIGGAVAQTVGRLLKRLGQDRQVLAVTHLPQVAACADHHQVVVKQTLGQSTTSSVAAVRGEPRVSEVARMLAGEKLSATTLAHAREMLQSSG